MEQAFTALSENGQLCSYVRELEVRVWPLASPMTLDGLQEKALSFFRKAINLRKLVR